MYVHYGPPSDIETFIQQVGCAGRDNYQSYSKILFFKPMQPMKIQLLVIAQL